MLSAFQEVQESRSKGSQQHTDFDCRMANEKTTVKGGEGGQKYRFEMGTAGKQTRKWQD